MPWSVPVLAESARALLRPGGRRLLGLTGPPGAGKSTLAAELCAALGPVAACVPMDGFHLANQVLRQLGLADRKGSPPSFDVGGFQALLRRLRADIGQVVYAPEFRRELEEPIAGAIAVPDSVRLVVVEGNYLLLDDGPWRETASLLDQTWYLRPEEPVRVRRLLQRHRAHGRSEAEAAAWVHGNDEPNARLIAATAHRADRIVVPTAEG
ncbi:nucleoside/nucleotide kinase family protein [Streptacidiphilus sp. N1-3]|uniref:Nucleoside/nucleotide kinase family protein n=1 Tax=Streptacidiphilus alkalitolerans TaxID=3342712 RepID=A0ABV6WWU9_9ACTN